MTQKRERLQFLWQKSVNDQILLLTMIITLATISFSVNLNSYPWLQWLILFLLGISIGFFGINYIMVGVNEYLYWNYGLRDLRIRLSKKKKAYEKSKIIWIIFIGGILIGMGIYLLLVVGEWVPNPSISS